MIGKVVDRKNCDQDASKKQVTLAPWQACNVFDNISDNCWMADVKCQDIKIEFYLKEKLKFKLWMNADISKSMNQRYRQLSNTQKWENPDVWKRYKGDCGFSFFCELFFFFIQNKGGGGLYLGPLP